MKPALETRSSVRSGRILGAAVVVGALAMTAHAQWSVVNLNPTSGEYPPWPYESAAFGVQGGQQVGWVRPESGYSQASLWTGAADPWINLSPGAVWVCQAYGVYNGQQVGSVMSALRPRPPYPYSYYPSRASLWTGSAGSRVDLHIETPGAEPGWSVAYGVYGDRVVGEADVPYTQAIVWTLSPGSWSWLSLHPLVQPFEANWSIANSVYGDQVVGEAEALRGEPSAYVRQACLWTWDGEAWSWMSLHPAEATASSAHGVHDAQQVGDAWVPVNGTDQECAILWFGSADPWINLNPSLNSVAASASAAMGVYRGVQVGSAIWNDQSRASLWTGTAASWVDLHAWLPSDFTESYASGIWDDGVYTYVVGWGYNSAPYQHREALMWVAMLGACCNQDSTCAVKTQADCTGTWLGAGTTCTPNPCSQPQGACCLPGGSCTLTTQAACTAPGNWLGPGSVCNPNPCPQPQGACCLPGGMCLPGVSETDCSGQSGWWQGANSTCAPNPCRRVGDLNCDSLINVDDIVPFVLALTDVTAYGSAYPYCDQMMADCNGDGRVDGLDIESFVILITNASQPLTVPGVANIFGAGHAWPPAPGGGGEGTLPVVFTLPPGTARVVRFSNITGTVSCCGDPPTVGPDGIVGGSCDIASYGGISGIVHNNRQLFLAGVFLDDSEPADPAPPRLDCTADDFPVVAPVLGQTFFIGDGLTGTGSGEVQMFVAPAGATRLFLGFADALAFQGPPGWYYDNLGELAIASITVSEAPSGACCLSGGVCVPGLSEAGCLAQNGQWQGADSTCDPNPCP